MGTRLVPTEAVLACAFVVLVVVGLGASAAAAPIVVGTVKCLDCSPMDVSAEDGLQGMQNARLHDFNYPVSWPTGHELLAVVETYTAFERDLWYYYFANKILWK